MSLAPVQNGVSIDSRTPKPQYPGIRITTKIFFCGQFVENSLLRWAMKSDNLCGR